MKTGRKRDFGLETMKLTRKIMLTELSGIRRDYCGGCFDNALAKCDSLAREVRRLKGVIRAEKRERMARGQIVRVALSAQISGETLVRVPEGADVEKFVRSYLRRKRLRASHVGIYTNEKAEFRVGDELKAVYPW